MKRRIGMLFSTLVLLGCMNCGPSDADMTALISSALNQKFDYVDVVVLDKTNGAYSDADHYSANIRYKIRFTKTGDALGDEIQSQIDAEKDSAKQLGIMARGFRTAEFGEFKKGQVFTIQDEIRFVRSANGWTLVPNQDLIDAAAQQERAVLDSQRQQGQGAQSVPTHDADHSSW